MNPFSNDGVICSLKGVEYTKQAAPFCNLWTLSNSYDVAPNKRLMGYISNESCRFHIFIANLFQQIRDFSNPNQWRNVSSVNNPADEGSRGISVTELHTTSKWLRGPDFLWNKDLPTKEGPSQHQLCKEDPEVNQESASTCFTVYLAWHWAGTLLRLALCQTSQSCMSEPKGAPEGML